MSSKRRRFSRIERLRIYLRSKGICQECGDRIGIHNFHADHIVPWSKGGETVISNAQALCPSCNFRKGSSMAVSFSSPSFSDPKFHLPAGWELRQWQSEFLERFLYSAVTQINKPPSDIAAFILHAFPGAGKSIAQTIAGKLLIVDGYIDKVVICVPSDVLKDQMENDGRQVGLYLSKKISDIMNPKFCGIVVSYQQLGYVDKSTKRFVNAEVIKEFCKHNKVMVCGDEMHHIADNKNWGQGFKLAFDEYSRVRLLTSGTPFRSDGGLIPWTRYVKGKIDLSPPNAYSYGYGYSVWNHKYSALADRVVRDVVFHPWDGEVSFKISVMVKGPDVGVYTKEEMEFRHRITDNIDKLYPDILDENGKVLEDRSKLRNRIKSARRKACLECGTEEHPYGTEYVKTQLIAANKQLDECRKTHPWASGLIVCMTTKHADQVAKALKHWTNEEAVVVHENSGADRRTLMRFRENRTPAREKWLVAVRKVSEGVDVKHLRVCVYMTHITAPLLWLQILGRILRVEEICALLENWEMQTAHMYQYDDGLELDEDENGDLVDASCNIKLYAETLMEERYITIEGGKEKKPPPPPPTNCHICGHPLPCPHHPWHGEFTTVSAHFATGENKEQIYQDERYENKELDSVRVLAARLNMTPVKVLAMLKKGGEDEWEKAAKQSRG